MKKGLKKKTSNKSRRKKNSKNSFKKSLKKSSKKISKKNSKKKNNKNVTKLTLGQRTADKITGFGGSWTFILSFLIFLVIWIIINVVFLITTWDPYPFILLNLVLSCLAAIQAPLILMSQNRQAERDRVKAERDYYVNRKAEREVKGLQRELRSLRRYLKNNQH